MDVATSHGRLSTTTRDVIARGHRPLIGGPWVEAQLGTAKAVAALP